MKEELFSRQLIRYNRLLKKNDDIYRQVARELDMPEATLWIIYFLRDENVHTQKDLCDMMFQSKQSVNSALKKLEQDGIVYLEAAEDDRKKKNIRLTAKGEKLASLTADKIIRAEKSALARMSDEDRESYLDLVERFTVLLEEEMKQAVREKEGKEWSSL